MVRERARANAERVGVDVDARGLFRAGARLEVVTDLSAPSDATQLSILPYAGLRAAQWFADGGMLINITSPYGFSFDYGKAWGLRARVGLRF